jgi:hypothetical protein
VEAASLAKWAGHAPCFQHSRLNFLYCPSLKQSLLEHCLARPAASLPTVAESGMMLASAQMQMARDSHQPPAAQYLPV